MVNKASISYILNNDITDKEGTETLPRSSSTPSPAQRNTFFVVRAPVIRSRRKFFEVRRIHCCGYQGCKKSYGTLNHLNTHVRVKGHGEKRDPIEFVQERRRIQALDESQQNPFSNIVFV